jgi:beta-fructofuranosidase
MIEKETPTMPLHFDDKWLWDFWFAQDGADYHMFYLQADRALLNPDLRHWNVSIGHAVSQDLRQWTILPDALRPSERSGDFDDNTTWTGSIIHHDGCWYLFYTGSMRADKGLVQRIGMATSNDLIHWEKAAHNPLIVADPQWYELLDLNLWHDQAWRDPHVVRDPQNGEFHAFITARVNYGAKDGRGVIAHAVSRDLLQWQVQPPVTTPGDFGQMEVPQLLHIGSLYYLLFSTGGGHHSAARQQRGAAPVTGTHYLVSEKPYGPFRYLTDEFFVGDARGSLYSGKMIQGPDAQWYFMGFLNDGEDGQFIGDISDPLPVEVLEDGRLRLKQD